MNIKLLLLSILLLAGCSMNFPGDSGKPAEEQPKPADNPNSQDITEKPDDQTPAKPNESNVIKDFFPEPNQVRFYKGSGNEFAEEKEIIFDLQDEYLPAIVNNGGTSILKVYKLTDKGIYLVYQQPEYYEEDVPELESIKGEFKEIPLLVEPLVEGSNINGWTIVDVDQNLLLPIGSIQSAVVLELENEDGSISRQYWAQGYGLVKKEFYMKDSEGTETFITTELMNIESRP